MTEKMICPKCNSEIKNLKHSIICKCGIKLKKKQLSRINHARHDTAEGIL